LCFALFGLLTATHLPLKAGQMAGYALYGGVFALVSLLLFSLVLAVVNPGAGMKRAFAAACSGFLMVIPFTVLAILAELVLRWNAVQAFASVGLMTAGGTAGMELAKSVGKQLLNAIIPAISAFFLTAAWILATPLAIKWATLL
jgi:hypothetical protein